MPEPETPPPRRHRRRGGSPQGEPPRRAPAAQTEPERPHKLERPAKPEHRSPRERNGSRAAAERGMRDLAGPGASQVGISAALRARAVNHPTPDDLAAAERELRIVRRDWRPPPN